jgi:hypothetical protein
MVLPEADLQYYNVARCREQVFSDAFPKVVYSNRRWIQGAAAACLNNPICRGFQVCWSFPAASTYNQQANVRLKAGPQAPLNITGALQNPYCSVYVLKAGAASAPNSGQGGYSLKDTTNATAINSAAQALVGAGRRMLQTGGWPPEPGGGSSLIPSLLSQDERAVQMVMRKNLALVSDLKRLHEGLIIYYNIQNLEGSFRGEEKVIQRITWM